MADRRSLRDRAAKLKESLAGTVGDAADSARQAVANRRARRELQEFRDEEVTDQGEARLQRARQQAQQEARQEARQEFVKEYREEVRTELRDEELQRLRREYDVGQDPEPERQQQQPQRRFEPGLPAQDPVDEQVPANPLLGGSASDDVGPQIPPLFPEDDRDGDDRGPRLPF